MLEFLNTLLIKSTNIYFGHKDKVYVISKQLIGDVFGMCAKAYVEKLKGMLISREQFRHYKIVNLHLQFLLQINGMQRAWVFHICQISYHYICHLSEGEGIVF
jgi:hypothetical protein